MKSIMPYSGFAAVGQQSAPPTARQNEKACYLHGGFAAVQPPPAAT